MDIFIWYSKITNRNDGIWIIIFIFRKQAHFILVRKKISWNTVKYLGIISLYFMISLNGRRLYEYPVCWFHKFILLFSLFHLSTLDIVYVKTDDTFLFADQFMIHIYVGEENWKLINGCPATMAHSYNVCCLVKLGFLFPDLNFLIWIGRYFLVHLSHVVRK